jgi:hypothetical protein
VASEAQLISWDDVVKGVAEPVAATRVQPDPDRHLMYGGLMRMYAECEERSVGDSR